MQTPAAFFLVTLTSVLCWLEQGSDNYKARRSYLPETGPLYDTVRQLQGFFRSSQYKAMGSPPHERARHNLNSTIEEVADSTSASCGVFAQEGCSELAE